VTLTVTDANGNTATATATVTVSAPALTTTTWTGASSTAWTDCANWSYGLLPTASVSAMLPAGMPRYPSLPAGTYSVLDLTIASGASLATTSTATLRMSGSYANNGGTVALSGPVVFTESAATQTVGGSAGTNFGAVTVDKASGSVMLSQILNINTSLTMTSGLLTTGTTYKVALRSSASLYETETSYVSGTVETNQNLNTAGTGSSFGGIGLTLTPAAASPVLPGSTLVRRVTGSPATGVSSSVGIARYFDIQPTVDTNLNVTMVFAYADCELNGIAENRLKLFKSESSAAGPWARIDGASYDASTNTVTKTGITSLSLWTLGNADAPLPVELTAFMATPQGPQAVHLTWTTATEKNSEAFEVERSADGQQFGRIGTVAAAGSSSTPHAYGLTDAKLPAAATLYYRLHQLDLNGSFHYSPVRTVTRAGTAAGLSLFPNPTTGTAMLSGTAPGTVVRVHDALGREVLAATADATGTAALVLPRGHATGVYVVRVGEKVLRLTVE
jgi:hypothetical protein